MTHLGARTTLAALFLLGGSLLLVSLPLSQEGVLDSLSNSDTGVYEQLSNSILGIAQERGIGFGVGVVGIAIEGRDISSDECHSLLHLLGHQAYIQYHDDFDAIFTANKGKICLGGYLHGVEAQMAVDGFGAKNMLWEFCEQMKIRHLNNGPCFHGVGHAAFEFDHRVPAALAFCDALAGGSEPELWNCYRGVFSEFGNALLGIDTNTGTKIRPLVYPGLLPERPFGICDQLAATYRDSCFSQLTKVFFQSNEPVQSISACVDSTDSEIGKRYCVEILSGITARILLGSGSASDVAAFVEKLPAAEQRPALSGVREAYIGHVENGGVFEWGTFCDALSGQTTREACLAEGT